MAQGLFSDMLENLNFTRSKDAGGTITKTPHVEDRGTFYRGGFAGVLMNTIAVDEYGYLWGKNGHIDLTPHGFKEVFGTIVH